MTGSVKLDKTKLVALIRAEPGRVEEVLDKAAFEGQRIVVQSFGSGPGGRTYVRHGVAHTASQPNYPPNVDIGTLKNAIHVQKRGRLTRVISTGSVQYAFYLEFGTRRMAARPFMGPMAEELRGQLPGLFKVVVQA